MQKKILLIELCDYENHPIGGHLSFAKQFIKAFGDEIALVGVTINDETPVGHWTKRKIEGIEYDYYSVKKVNPTSQKGLIPDRVKGYFYIRKHKKKILSLGYKNVIIQTPEVFFNFRKNNTLNICLRLPGLSNPLSISRYSYGKFFASIYEKVFFRAINNANILLAAADNEAISNFINRGGNKFDESKLVQFPTRFDDSIFMDSDKLYSRELLNLPEDITLVVTSGRLSSFKGWKFIIDSFLLFSKSIDNAIFVFLGDGEDKEKIEYYIREREMQKKILLIGQVDHSLLSKYLNAADLFIMGSYAEGWSTALVEAIACATPICTTNFSSAKELVIDNINGFVLDERNEILFSGKMLDAINLPKDGIIKMANEIKKLSVSNLKKELFKHWKLI